MLSPDGVVCTNLFQITSESPADAVDTLRQVLVSRDDDISTQTNIGRVVHEKRFVDLRLSLWSTPRFFIIADIFLPTFYFVDVETMSTSPSLFRRRRSRRSRRCCCCLLFTVVQKSATGMVQSRNSCAASVGCTKSAGNNSPSYVSYEKSTNSPSWGVNF